MTAVQSYINGQFPYDFFTVLLCLERFYREAQPNWAELDQKTRDLLVENISINAGYNSQIVPPPGGASGQAKQVSVLFIVGHSMRVNQKQNGAEQTESTEVGGLGGELLSVGVVSLDTAGWRDRGSHVLDVRHCAAAISDANRIFSIQTTRVVVSAANVQHESSVHANCIRITR